jgi:serine/threonine-protein kinase
LLSQRLLDQREAGIILSKISRAIQYAHSQGLLHRDLKPSNILIDSAGEPHVSDFGLAKEFREGSTLSRTGAVIGTPSYMAPEQAVGDRGTVGPASDVYGLGSILYHALTGRPPFQAASAVDTVLMLLEQEPIPPRVLTRNIDRRLEMITLKCLQKPIDLRYSSAESLANDLDAYLQDEPISASSGAFSQLWTRVFRETHHATVLQNWGVLWMWHSLVLLVACLATQWMYWRHIKDPWQYMLVWTVGLGTWAAVFWMLRRRMGPVTFVERQIAHVWAGSLICVAALFPLEQWLNLPVLYLSPVLGLINGMAFLVKAGILSGSFYVQAVAMFITAAAMAYWPDWSHVIFGIVSASCFFFPGLKYYRKRVRGTR